MNGQLEKLIITSYTDAERKNKDKEYTVLLNPEQIALDTKIEYETSTAAGQSGQEKKFKGVSSPKLSLKLLFDGTGVLPAPKLSQSSDSMPVPAVADQENLSAVNMQIEAFKAVAEYYYGSEHKTREVTLFWGELSFKGVLESLKINYTLFNPDGTPLRATGDAVFIGSIDPVTRKKEEHNQSPDLTHIRVVKKGETLPYLCEKIYNNAKLYIEVAKVNKLSNYRDLQVGQKLFFPPLNNAN